MTTSESKGRFFLLNESIRIDSHNESNRIANWNALVVGRGRRRRCQIDLRLRLPPVAGDSPSLPRLTPAAMRHRAVVLSAN